MERQKVKLKIRVEGGKTYVTTNGLDWITGYWDDLTDDMKLVLNTLCRMDEFDLTIDAKNFDKEKENEQ